MARKRIKLYPNESKGMAIIRAFELAIIRAENNVTPPECHAVNRIIADWGDNIPASVRAAVEEYRKASNKAVCAIVDRTEAAKRLTNAFAEYDQAIPC